MPELRLVACHRLPSRSFFLRGRQFPVCARCTGIAAGFLAYPAFLFGLVGFGIWTALLLHLPLLLDGASQAAGWRESNNLVRFITGLLGGVGQVAVIAVIGRALAGVVVRAYF